QAPDPTPVPRQTGEAGPEALSTVSLPSFVSSPWIRRYPHRGFSFASRTTRRAMLRTVGGRPGARCLLVSYFFAASLRCQASNVAGVTGKPSLQWVRGISPGQRREP